MSPFSFSKRARVCGPGIPYTLWGPNQDDKTWNFGRGVCVCVCWLLRYNLNNIKK